MLPAAEIASADNQATSDNISAIAESLAFMVGARLIVSLCFATLASSPTAMMRAVPGRMAISFSDRLFRQEMVYAL
ncbi:hypothetical protein BAL199_17523 [alpha proteobacterium BAL199]|nr:hypothetical protein BAL199_17523 [alpha proteobacterium BAL199]